jgi:hypothetical protein
LPFSSILAFAHSESILEDMRSIWVFPLVIVLVTPRQPGPWLPLPGPADPSPPLAGQACIDHPHLRRVPVATSDQLTRALGTAEPGDLIDLAEGSYRGRWVINVSGTSGAPITLCGPRTAVIDNNGGQITHEADWWVYRGFTIRHGLYGIRAGKAHHNLFDSLLVEHVGQEGVMFTDASSTNTVQRSTIRYTGEWMPLYGEAVYIGNGHTDADPSNDNRILRNTFGPGVSAEHVDIKRGTVGNLVQGNVSDATGFQFVSGSVTAILVTGGTRTSFLDNTVRNISGRQTHGFQSWQGNQTRFHGNTAIGAFAYGFRVDGGTANVVGCDNVVLGAASGFANVPCE